MQPLSVKDLIGSCYHTGTYKGRAYWTNTYILSFHIPQSKSFQSYAKKNEGTQIKESSINLVMNTHGTEVEILPEGRSKTMNGIEFIAFSHPNGITAIQYTYVEYFYRIDPRAIFMQDEEKCLRALVYSYGEIIGAVTPLVLSSAELLALDVSTNKIQA